MSTALYLTKYAKDDNGNFYDGSAELISHLNISYETSDLLEQLAPLRNVQMVETKNCFDYFTSSYWNDDDISMILSHLEKIKNNNVALEDVYDFLKLKENYKDNQNIILKLV